MTQPVSEKDFENASAFAESLRQKMNGNKTIHAALEKHATPEQLKAIRDADAKLVSVLFNKAANAKKTAYQTLIARAETYAAVLTNVQDDKIGEEVSAFLRNNFKRAVEKYGEGWPEVYREQGAPTLAKFAAEALRK